VPTCAHGPVLAPRRGYASGRGRRHPRRPRQARHRPPDIVGHDIGRIRVCLRGALSGQDKPLVVIDSPIPGIPPWNQIMRLPALLALQRSRRPGRRRPSPAAGEIYLDRSERVRPGPSKIHGDPRHPACDLTPQRGQALICSTAGCRSRRIYHDRRLGLVDSAPRRHTRPSRDVVAHDVGAVDAELVEDGAMSPACVHLS